MSNLKHPTPGTIRSELTFAAQYIFKPFEGSFGIEIETEVPDSEDYPSGFFVPRPDERYDIQGLPDWEGHIDNSLRNFGMEFVLKEPKNFEEAKQTIKDWKNHVSGIPFIKNAPATSVHVHLNFLEDSFLTLGNFLTLWTLFENVFVDYSGPARRSNLFSLPMRSAEVNVDYIVRIFEKLKAAQWQFGLNDNNAKYAACNLASLSGRGSIEIRCFRGSTSASEINAWLSILSAVKDFSRIEGLTPRAILTEYRDRGTEFLSGVLNESYEDVRNTVQDIETLIERNLWYAHQIASVMTEEEWLELPTKITKTLNIDTSEQKPKPPKKKKVSDWVSTDEVTYVNSFLVQLANTQPLVSISSFDEEF